MVESKSEDLWEDIPFTVYIALGRRGQEKLRTDQCFISGCKNEKLEDLTPIDKKTYTSEKDKDGSYYNCTQVKVKCKICGGVFQYAMKTIYAPIKDDNNELKVQPYMNMMYILDENGKNTGFLGYF